MISNDLLKERILDSALRGTLVENDLSLPSFDVKEDNSVPFEIPSNWKWVKIEEIFDVKGGKRIPRGENFSDEGNQVYIRVADMENMSVNMNNLKYIDEKVHSMIKNYIITKNDLYITVAGTIGKVGSIPDELDGMNLTENANRLIPKNVDKEYYKYILNGKYMQECIRNNTTKAAQSKLAIKRINELKVPLPPLEEQHKIANRIEELFCLVDKKEKNDKEKEKLKALLKEKLLDSAIKDNFETNLRNDKQYPFNIPNSWTWKSLNDISEKIVDGDHNPPKGENDFTDYFMLSAINICDNGLNEASNIRYLSKENFELSAKRTNVEKGDILLSIVGTIGKCCIYNSESNITFQRSVSVIKPSKIIYNKYLLYCLKTPFIQKYMNDNSAGAVQRGFYLKQLKELLIPVPPLEEQHRIVEKIEQCFELIEQL